MKKEKDIDYLDDVMGLCELCQHYNHEEYGTCKAFPNGIPLKYTVEGVGHMMVDPRQEGAYVLKIAT